MMASRRIGAAVAGLALAAGIVTGCATTDPGSPPSVQESATPSANPFDAGGLQDPNESVQTVSTATPVRVSIPSIGVDSALEDLGLGPSGELEAPVDFDLAGWYSEGVVPGALGPAIIAGHVDSVTAPAVFARIAELAPGDEVTVTMSDGTAHSFRITGSVQSAKSNFPTDEVYRNVPAPELRLITCAGAFDSSIGHYTDNLIVFASMIS